MQSYQRVVQRGAALLLADIALYKGNSINWQNAITLVKSDAGYPRQNSLLLQAISDITCSILLIEAGDAEHVADWLKAGRLQEHMLTDPLRASVFYAYLLLLRSQEDWTRLIGTLEALSPEVWEGSIYARFLFSILMVTGYNSVNDHTKVTEFLAQAVSDMLSDGLIIDLVSFSWPFQNLIEELIGKDFPQYLLQFDESRKQRAVGWKMLHDALGANEQALGLTEREREIALLAAKGLHNNEIAAQLFVSESTVRTHLRSVFQKLGVDRRSKLTEKLN